jgi:flagellar hook-associated protein 2
MAGIQISGLLSNSAFDWKSVVDQLIAAESIPLNTLTTQKTTNTTQISALADLQTKLQALQDSVQAIRAGDLFSARTVTTDSNSTWNSTSSTGATIGTYTIAVQHLAAKALTQGLTDVGSGLSATSNVSGLTVANISTAQAITAGNITVDGQQIAVATTDSLQDVFDKIHAATGDVTGSYDPMTDAITLTRSTSDPVVLGATNDTSNFLQAMKLSNTGTNTVTSSGTLGVVNQTAAINSAGLKTALTGLDGSGNGSFTINGVAISYNATTDTMGGLISRINKSGAGVTAGYDSVNDRFTITNNTTGDVGMGLNDTAGNLLAAMGLTTASGGAFVRGANAVFTVNGGAPITSASNTLTSAVHGITGLSVTVNTQTTQTLQVESDVTSMQSAIQTFMDSFNAVQTAIDTDTATTVAAGAVTTSVLSDNRDIPDWATKLRSLAFDSISGLSGTINRLDNLGIDFDGTTGQLKVKDTDKLATALSDKPDDVQEFFLSPTTGFVAKMFNYLTTTVSDDTAIQNNISKSNSDIAQQVTTLQARLDADRETLTNAFIAMLDAQSAAETQSTTLTNAFSKSSS